MMGDALGDDMFVPSIYELVRKKDIPSGAKRKSRNAFPLLLFYAIVDCKADICLFWGIKNVKYYDMREIFIEKR